MNEKSADVIVVGAGVIGMSAALELADRGVKVVVFDRGKPGGESSWAGAGIIYPAFVDHATDPFERLRAESFAAWPTFVERLGEDVGFLRCGGIVLEKTEAELDRVAADHRRAGAIVQPFSLGEGTSPFAPQLASIYPFARAIPQMCQVRNPWLVRALANRLKDAGVRVEQASVTRILQEGDRTIGVELAGGERCFANQVLLTAGAWTPELAGEKLEIVPVRGQIVLLRPETRLLAEIVDCGKHYLVPRGDGRILAGSTEELAGFDKSITDDAFAELYSFAVSVLPELRNAAIEASWAGLRPGTRSGTPYLFESERRRGHWVGAGHFRLGLQLAPGTAKLLADWMTGRPSFAAQSDFSPTADRSRYARHFTA